MLDLIRGKSRRRGPTRSSQFTERDVAVVDPQGARRRPSPTPSTTTTSTADELFVSACFADEGPTLKRWRPRARGRATRIRKRTCHITVIVSRYRAERARAASRPRGAAAGRRRPPRRAAAGRAASRRSRVARSRGRRRGRRGRRRTTTITTTTTTVDDDDRRRRRRRGRRRRRRRRRPTVDVDEADVDRGRRRRGRAAEADEAETDDGRRGRPPTTTPTPTTSEGRA